MGRAPWPSHPLPLVSPCCCSQPPPGVVQTLPESAAEPHASTEHHTFPWGDVGSEAALALRSDCICGFSPPEAEPVLGWRSLGVVSPLPVPTMLVEELFSPHSASQLCSVGSCSTALVHRMAPAPSLGQWGAVCDVPCTRWAPARAPSPHPTGAEVPQWALRAACRIQWDFSLHDAPHPTENPTIVIRPGSHHPQLHPNLREQQR